MYNLRLLKFYDSTYSKFNGRSRTFIAASKKNGRSRKLLHSTYPAYSKVNGRSRKLLHSTYPAYSKFNGRLLKLHDSTCSIYSKVNFSEGPSVLSNKLRCLIWHGYPLQALPSNFNPNNLVELDLRGSNLERLWEDRMPAPNLRRLNLSGCTRVTKIQGLSKSPLLVSITLKDCSSLLDFPQLAQHLKNLRYLDRSGCNNLRSFPSDIHFESLTSLDLSNCNNLTKFGSQISGNNITRLDLSGTAIKELHHSISHLNGLVELFLRRCENLETLPSGIHFESLTSLDLSNCNNLTKFPQISGNNITRLDLSGTAIKELHHSISHLNGLKDLFLRRCENLETLPSGIHFESLTSLDLSNCNNLTKFPQISGNNITRLDLSGTAIKELHHSIGHLNGLKKLFLRRCENLETLTSGICNLTSLRHLDLLDCSRLEILPENLGNLISLEYLSAERAAIKELPHSIAHLNGLEELFLGGCENLETLPSGIFNLTSLRHLDLSDCSRLEILPENLGNLISLEYLSADRIAICQLPYSMKRLKELQRLFLGYCYASYSSLFERKLKNYSFEFRLSEESPNYRLKSCGVWPISDTDDRDEAGTSGSRFDEEMEPHPKENENLQTVKYAEPIEHIGETSGIRRSRASNDHLEEEVEPHPKRLNI
ncbi:hypothetical protein LWI29_019423 [Acer saccharum]|uniref:Disease resistance R13L4/SHOC-2-like LRR domain-containing protein n=1 Tax=Acer saccharum TaxID=4024 RepID=A0AA39SM53_ACESA|nr:hypothetical protein LWI29_019423 [Acer saccharum]